MHCNSGKVAMKCALMVLEQSDGKGKSYTRGVRCMFDGGGGGTTPALLAYVIDVLIRKTSDEPALVMGICGWVDGYLSSG